MAWSLGYRIEGVSYSKLKGIKTDGITDDASAIQAVLTSRGSIVFAIGTTLIGTKLTTPTSPPSEGFSVVGVATTGTDPINTPSIRAKTSSILAWVGATSGTLFESTDHLNLIFANLVFHGQDEAGILVHFKYATAGSGVSRFSNVNFFNADTLVKCGVAEGDTTCSDLFFDQCGMKNADYGLEVVNAQGLNYNFNQLSAQNISSVVRMTEGGSVQMNVSNFVGCGDDSNGDYSIHITDAGDNNFSFVANTIRFEQGCENFFYGRNFGESVINSLVEAQSSSGTNKIKLMGHSLTINNSMITSWDSLVDMDQLTGKAASMHFNNVFFNSVKTFDDLGDMFLLNVNVPHYITIRGCRVKSAGGSPTYLRDFNSSLKNGPVEHTVQITGNGTSKNAYLFGETAQTQYNVLELEVGANVLETRITGVETTSGERIGATLSGTLHWSGSTLTVLEQSVTNKYTDDASVFNSAQYVASVRGARVEITNVTGTWDYVAVTRKIA